MLLFLISFLGRTATVFRAAPYRTLSAVLLAGFLVPFCYRHQSDFEQVYLPAARDLAAGAEIYQPGGAYLYPPLFAWLMQPLARLPAVEARGVWFLVNVLAILVLFRGAWTLSGGGRVEGARVPFREHVILLFGLLAGVYYTADALTNQQTDLVVAAVMVGGCLCLRADQTARAATLFGTAAALKCTPLLWAPYLVWRRKPAAAAWVVVVAVGLNFLPDVVTHPPRGGTWVGGWAQQYLLPLAEPDRDPGVWGSAINFNHSLGGLCNRYLTGTWWWEGTEFRVGTRPDRLSTGYLKLSVRGLEALAILAAAAAMARAAGTARRVTGVADAEPAAATRLRTGLEYSLVTTLMVLLSPMSSKPHFCTLVLPGWCLARLAFDRGDWRSAGLLSLAAATGLLSNKDLFGNQVYAPAVWTGTVTWNALFLYSGCVAALSAGRPVGQAVGAGAGETTGLVGEVIEPGRLAA